MLGLSQKRRCWFEKEFKGRQCFFRSNTKALRSALLSYAFAQPPSITQQVINTGFFNESSSTTVPYTVANERDLSVDDRKQDNEVGLDDAIKDLAGVLSSVENQLGLVAIEGGDLREGLAMLHSAAQRNHAPALYNLAICYEKGLGMKKNEKMVFRNDHISLNNGQYFTNHVYHLFYCYQNYTVFGNSSIISGNASELEFVPCYCSNPA